MRPSIALALSVLASTPAIAQKPPSFKPAEVKKQCQKFRDAARAVGNVDVASEIVNTAVARTVAATEEREYRRARAIKKEFVETMTALINAFDQAMEAQMYLYQLVDHLKTLPPGEAEQFVPHMIPCFAAAKEMGDLGQAVSASPAPTAATPTSLDDDPLSGGVVD